MLIFMLCINPIIEKLELKYDIISYADDILLGVDININPQDIILEIQELLKEIGL